MLPKIFLLIVIILFFKAGYRSLNQDLPQVLHFVTWDTLQSTFLPLP